METLLKTIIEKISQNKNIQKVVTIFLILLSAYLCYSIGVAIGKFIYNITN